MPPDRGLAKEAEKGVKGVKSRLTIAVTTNADGSDRCPLLFIGKYRHPQPFKRQGGREAHNIDYYWNDSSWMNTVIFNAWISKWDIRLGEQKRKILLLVDNFSGHTVPDGFLKNIRLEKFRPNLTSRVQPCDAGIIRALKAHYRARFIHRSIRLFADGKRGSELYKIDILSAMRMAKQAWYSVTAATIQSCWDHTRIVEFHHDSILCVLICTVVTWSCFKLTISLIFPGLQKTPRQRLMLAFKDSKTLGL